MQVLIFLNFALYMTLQRMGFVAKWLVAMKFFMSGFTSAFSVDRHGASACGVLGASWQHAGQSYCEASV